VRDRAKPPSCESTRRQPAHRPASPAIGPSTRFSTDGTMPRSPAHAVFALSLLACVCPSTLCPTRTPLTRPSAWCPLLHKTGATAPAGVKPTRAAALKMRGGAPALNDAELYLEGVGVRLPLHPQTHLHHAAHMTPRPPAPLTRTRRASRCSVPSYLRLIDSCLTQLKAQGPSRTCNESKEGRDAGWAGTARAPAAERDVHLRDWHRPRPRRVLPGRAP